MNRFTQSACMGLLGLAASAAPAQGQPDPLRQGVYVSAAAGRNNYEWLIASCAFTTCSKVNFGSNVLRVAAGYGWQIVGGELTYTDYGRGGSAIDSRHITAPGVAAFIRIRPLGPVELSLRLGMAQAHESRVDGGVASSRNFTMKTATAGIGLDVHPQGTIELLLDVSNGRKENQAGTLSALLAYRHHF
jgi:hypothetical protein